MLDFLASFMKYQKTADNATKQLPVYFHFSHVLATSDSIIVSYRVSDRLVQPESTEETIIKKQIRMNRVDSERNQVRKQLII